MERLTSSPNLPSGPVSLAAVSAEYQYVLDALRRLGIRTITVDRHPALLPPEASHADMRMVLTGNGRLLVSDYTDALREQLEQEGVPAVEANPLFSAYPRNVGLNAAWVGKRLFCHPEAADPLLLEEAGAAGMKILPVKQGYARCSICIVDENSIITSDKGIADAAKRDGMSVLLIRSGGVSLPGFGEGFIGGASFLLDSRRLAFIGRIEDHPDYGAIRSFLKEQKVSYLNLLNMPLLDLGGLVILKEKKKR